MTSFVDVLRERIGQAKTDNFRGSSTIEPKNRKYCGPSGNKEIRQRFGADHTCFEIWRLLVRGNVHGDCLFIIPLWEGIASLGRNLLFGARSSGSCLLRMLIKKLGKKTVGAN